MRLITFLAAASLLTVACAANNDDSGESTSADLSDLKKSHPDAGGGPVTTTDGGSASGGDDGTPTRRACTSSLGSGLSGGTHGRLDGTVVAVVPAGSTRSCNGDSGHDHIQVLMGGAVYDVAVNVESIDFATTDAPLVGGAWSEGWHAGTTLDYPTDLNLHSTDFQNNVPQSTLMSDVEGALANANHVSVFATKYSNSGIHLVHRNGSGNDGAIIIDPLSAKPHYLIFHFDRQTF